MILPLFLELGRRRVRGFRPAPEGWSTENIAAVGSTTLCTRDKATRFKNACFCLEVQNDIKWKIKVTSREGLLDVLNYKLYIFNHQKSRHYLIHFCKYFILFLTLIMSNLKLYMKWQKCIKNIIMNQGQKMSHLLFEVWFTLSKNLCMDKM